MAVIALAISIAALFVGLFVGLACAELAQRVAAGASHDGAVLKELSLPEHVFGKRPSDFRLPRTLDQAKAEIVLFVSPMCKTCDSLASNLARELPAGLTLVATAGS